MKINKIEKLKTGKYKVQLDNETITTYDDVLLKNNILYKKEIDMALLETMKKDNLYYEAYNKTVNYILRRIRSHVEVKEYLKKFELSLKDNESIIMHLEEVGLLNDFNYAKAYVADALYLSNDGPNKIREFLLKQQIEENIVEEVISNIDLKEVSLKAEKIIDKKIKMNHKSSSYQLKQKIILDMVNLGYSKELVIGILDRYEIKEDETLIKEYNKLYNQLSRKYQGNELYTKIKQKLYAKGFDINLINEYVIKKEGE